MKQPTAEAEPSAPGRVPRSRGPVLVVDSDAAVRRVVRLVLEGVGVRCLGCARAEEAASLIEDFHPALVLTEVRLPGKGGQDLARKLAHGAGWRPKVALMSAYPRPQKGFEDYFISKPIEFDRLLYLLDGLEPAR